MKSWKDETAFSYSRHVIQVLFGDNQFVQAVEWKNEFVISKQLLRSGTSIGANVEEASAAQSRRDFVTKMSIASKEARETRYWLRLLDQGELLDINVKDYLLKLT